MTPGWLFAMLAMLVLSGGCGVTSSERWVAEDRVEVRPLAAPEFDEHRGVGHLELRVTQETETILTPIERKYLDYSEVYSNVDWEEAGFVTMAVLGSVLLVFLYVMLFTFGEYDDDE
jgi:hypothetical protein